MSSDVTHNAKPIRIIIVDHQTLARELLRAALSRDRTCDVVDDAGSAAAAVASCQQLHPDLLILDMELLTDYSAAGAVADINRVSPDTRVLLCAAAPSQHRLLDFVRSGAHGFVAKTGSLDRLVEAVRRVASGERFFCIAPTAPPDEAHVARAGRGNKSLTPRQTEVLKLVAQGASSKKIAALLGIALKTVDTHRSDLMKRLRVRNAAGLAAYAFDMGFTGVRRHQSQPIAREQNYES